MSKYPAIKAYHEKVDKLKRVSILTESNLQPAFHNLLDSYAQKVDLTLVAQKKVTGKKIKPDGALLDDLKIPHGFLESKGPESNLKKEIEIKFRDGYPKENILFQNNKQAILYQGKDPVMQVDFADPERLDACLREFVSYEPAVVKDFNEAIKLFQANIPDLLKSLRKKIETTSQGNRAFHEQRDRLHTHCQEHIRPDITLADVGEMLIQHILTCDIFREVFNDPDFHEKHHLAKEVNRLQDALLDETLRKEFFSKTAYYYEPLRAAAAAVEDHRKQNFIKNIYEVFYKAYNPAAADTLGIVYTPSEIVRFMVRSADELLEKHFERQIGDERVNILDPATGTGTFISEIISYMEGQPDKLLHKYTNELHANEISLLAYYIAHLNITYTYKACTDDYKDFTGLCFVDTLVQGVDVAGKQMDFKAEMFGENTKRVKEQNKRNITLIIGNPPYNVGQQNANDNNPNPSYTDIDKRIKNTFTKHSTAQKNPSKDMYVRFYRWAMDRLKDEGMLAFITNRSFLDARSFDGFRQEVCKDFDYAYILDLDGDIRAKGKAAGGNVFNIMTGVAIMFLVKKKQKTGEEKRLCKIHYHTYDKAATRKDKLRALDNDRWSKLPHRPIDPDKNHNWLNLSDTDFDKLLPLCNKETKLAKNQHEVQALFKLYSRGVCTCRDAWVHDHDKHNLVKKIRFFIDFYNKEVDRWQNSNKEVPTKDFVNRQIKWTTELEAYMAKGIKLDYDENSLMPSLYRPFMKKQTYFSYIITHRRYQMPAIFGAYGEHKNTCLCFSGVSSTKGFQVLAVNTLPCLDMVEKTQCLPLYRYDADGQRHDNLTDWGMAQFREHYRDDSISQKQVFAYVYAVLHATTYRETYATDLTRHLPRVPYYADFHGLAKRGQALIDLHIDYEKTPQYKLTRTDNPLQDRKPDPVLKPVPKIDAEAGTITIDKVTTLSKVPKEAWKYTLGNRSALHWVVEQHKEQTKEQLPDALNLTPYHLATHKEALIVLLERVCTVACETVQLVKEIDTLLEAQKKTSHKT